MSSDNQRKHSRLSLAFKAEIVLSAGGRYLGQTSNISFSGALFVIDGFDCDECVLGQRGDAKVYLQQEPEVIAITFVAQVSRLTDEGFAVRFIATDLNSYEHFKQVMLFNCPDPDVLLEELDGAPGLDVHRYETAGQ